MNRIFKIAAAALFILVLSIGYMIFGVARYPLPWKVIDPHDPRFVAESFQYTDYYGRDSSKRLQEALRVMFPIGTPKEKVDKILYDNQPKLTKYLGWGAWITKYDVEIRKPTEKNVIYYAFTPYFYPINIYNIQVYFDENNKVKEIADHGIPLFDKNFYGDK